MPKVPFNPSEPGGLELVRQIVFIKLRNDSRWNQLDITGAGFEPYVEFTGGSQDYRRLAFLAQEVCWELIIQGVLAPGLDASNPNLPFFHITEYGRKVLVADQYIPHDPTGYLENLVKAVPKPDPTVVAYLSESLNCFTRGTQIAAVVMLGIAAERVFLLVCESLSEALLDQAEKSEFDKLMSMNAMKPKLDWVLQKMQTIQSRKGIPDNVNVMLSTIYDFIRSQRNDLGHPKDDPPNVTREETFVYLNVFPKYYKIAQDVRAFLATNKV